MSKFEDGSYGSLSGIALIAKVLAGRGAIRYTRAAVGNGEIPDDLTPKTMPGCAGYVMDAKIAGITNPVDGECQVTVQIKSDDVEHGFYATNIVLFAEDPDDGEVPFTYLSLENEPEWIRPASSIVGKLATFDLIAAVGDVDVVTATIDPEALMTRAEAEKLISASTALSVMELYIPRDGWKLTEEQEIADHGFTLYQDIEIPGVRGSQFPHISLYSDSMGVAENAGLCQTVQSFDGKVRLWSKGSPERDIEATLALYDVRSAVIKDITIPATGWKEIEAPAPLDEFASYPYYQDVPVGGLTQDRFPTLSLHVPSLSIAMEAGMCPSARALNGVLRLWSFRAPSQDMTATAAFLFHGSGLGFPNAIPISAPDELGGVKVKKGSGLKVDCEGYLSLDTASREEVGALFR